MRQVFAAIVLLSFLAGCQTQQPKPKAGAAETISALTTVTSGLTNKPVTEADLRNVAQQASSDPQTRSALREINGALSPQHTVKYCPLNGQRFSADMEYCPNSNVKLKWVE